MRYFLAIFLVTTFGAGCASQTPTTSETTATVDDIRVESEGEVTITPIVPDAEEEEEDPIVAVDVALSVNMAAKNFSFTPSTITAQTGQQVNVTFTNEGVHTFAIDELGLDKKVNAGGTISFTAPSTPGNYRFYCSVGSHAALGMEGTLIVQ